MLSRRVSLPPFVRDTIVAAIVYALIIGPTLLDLGPDLLATVGLALLTPMLMAYIMTGGETEWPYGPSTLLVVAYVLVLALLTAGVAHLLRTRFGLGGHRGFHFIIGGIPAVVGTILAILGSAGLAGFVEYETAVSVGMVIVGLVLVLGGLGIAAGRRRLF